MLETAVAVEADNRFWIDIASLEWAIEQAKQDDKALSRVVATDGTTTTRNIDWGVHCENRITWL